MFKEFRENLFATEFSFHSTSNSSTLTDICNGGGGGGGGANGGGGGSGGGGQNGGGKK